MNRRFLACCRIGISAIVLVEVLLEPAILRPQAISVKTEDGVTVVRNPNLPVPPPGYRSTASIVEELVIGRNQDKENYWFSWLNSLAVDEDGNIYTIDPKSIIIRVFDPKGRFLRAFGKSGQGPGEYSGPGQIWIRPNGDLVVYDVLSRRLTYLTPEGTVLKTVDAGRLPMGYFIMDSKGDIYLLKMSRDPKGLEELIKLDASFKPIANYHSAQAIGKRGMMNPFAPTCIFAVSKNDEFIWLHTSAYDIHVVNAKGVTVKRILKDHPSVKITDADKEKILKEERSRSGGIQVQYEFPGQYPVASRIVSDDVGKIYVKTYEKDGKGGTYFDVFDPEGRYISRFPLDERERVEVIKNDSIYTWANEGDEDIPLVKRYRIIWK